MLKFTNRSTYEAGKLCGYVHRSISVLVGINPFHHSFLWRLSCLQIYHCLWPQQWHSARDFFCTENMNQINKRHSMVKHIKHKTSCMKLSSTRFVVTELFFSKSAFVMFGVKKEHTLLRFYVKCNKTSP